MGVPPPETYWGEWDVYGNVEEFLAYICDGRAEADWNMLVEKYRRQDNAWLVSHARSMAHLVIPHGGAGHNKDGYDDTIEAENTASE